MKAKDVNENENGNAEEMDSCAFNMYMEIMRKELPIGESFDLLERKLFIGGRRASMFFVDGLTDGEKTQRILAYLMAVPAAGLYRISSSHRFIETTLPFLDTTVIEPKNGSPDAGGSGNTGGNLDDNAAGGRVGQLTREQALDCYNQMLPKLYAGLVPLLVEGLDRIIIIDCREYPSRSVEEPDKEKTLRGAKDGFTENFMENVALIRRRIRDNNLIFKAYNVGSVSKSDVAVVYLKNRADMQLIDKLDRCLKDMAPDATGMEFAAKSPSKSQAGTDFEACDGGRDCSAGTDYAANSADKKSHPKRLSSKKTSKSKGGGADVLSVADQSLLERLLAALGAANGLNPFPKVRYTQRPDIIAAHLAEGKAAIIVDNSPTVMMLPVSVFEFFQDPDDYYFPRLTGNYFRMIRIINFLVILFLTPVYLILAQNQDFTPEVLRFFVPEEDFAIPIFWQFILLEIAVDGLKLASLNTPTSLGMSLSVIGALILGEFSIDSGWFISQTILCMAVVALAAFTQPSIELSYAMKFGRILMLIGAQLFGIAGAVAAAALSFIVMAATNTLSGDSYLYPLIPFNGEALKRLIFRTKS
ncbi:MAG: spore germination protein [Anaerovoracaceae bacterium]